MKRRRLSDLYVRGRELTINDGESDPVKVWLAKVNELDRESALRRANAAKARFMLEGDDEDSDLFKGTYAEVRETSASHEDLLAIVIAEDLNKERRRIEAQHALDEETWNKDGYLQSLLDAWFGDDDNPGLSDVLDEDPDDPEACRVKDELDRFQAEIDADVRVVADSLKKDLQDVDLESLRRRAAHRLIELRAADAFRREYRRQQLFFALRDPTQRRNRYCETVNEVDDLDDELREYLAEQLDDLMVDREEGKDSPPPADSSTSSDSEDQPSGLVIASA